MHKCYGIKIMGLQIHIQIIGVTNKIENLEGDWQTFREKPLVH